MFSIKVIMFNKLQLNNYHTTVTNVLEMPIK